MTTHGSKWPSLLLVLRHAESEANQRREYLEKAESREVYLGLKVRDQDVPLTPLGREQARAAGRFLDRHSPIDALYVSPYARTRQTADLVIAELSRSPQLVRIEERIREKEFGILDELTRHGVRVLHPEEATRKELIGKYDYRPPGGESYPDVNLRLPSFPGTLRR